MSCLTPYERAHLVFVVVMLLFVTAAVAILGALVAVAWCS